MYGCSPSKTSFKDAIPVDDYHRLIIRRKCVWKDTIRQFMSGIDFNKYLRVTFVGSIGEPAVDDDGPFSEFLHLLMGAITGNEMLFQGEEYCRVPTTNVLELEKQTYKHVGEMFSVSIMYGWPCSNISCSFNNIITDYIIFGLKGVKACVDEIPCPVIKEN